MSVEEAYPREFCGFKSVTVSKAVIITGALLGIIVAILQTVANGNDTYCMVDWYLLFLALSLGFLVHGFLTCVLHHWILTLIHALCVDVRKEEEIQMVLFVPAPLGLIRIKLVSRLGALPIPGPFWNLRQRKGKKEKEEEEKRGKRGRELEIYSAPFSASKYTADSTNWAKLKKSDSNTPNSRN